MGVKEMYPRYAARSAETCPVEIASVRDAHVGSDERPRGDRPVSYVVREHPEQKKQGLQP